jgi:hypothetical protein
VRTTTRTLFAALALMAMFAVAVPAASAHDGGDTGKARHHGHTGSLADLRDATSPYRDGPGGPYTVGPVADLQKITCIADLDGSGTMGIHFANGASLGDGKVSAFEPELLVYEPQQGGGLELVAAEYLVFQSDWDANHNRPPVLFGQRFTLQDASNRFGLPAFYELHVWHGRSNADGLFADFNPDVHCVG